MANSERAVRYEQAVLLLPVKWQPAASSLPDTKKAHAEEIRLRVGHPPTVLLPEGEIPLESNGATVAAQDLEQLCDRVTEYSRYAFGNTVAQGFLAAPGGFRIGLCGQAVLENGICRNLRHLSSAAIRIMHEIPGVANDVLSELKSDGYFPSTVLVAPPGAGKTTLLRDMVRSLSEGSENARPQRIALLDERGEIAGSYQGTAQLDVGRHTDILDGCPKGQGIPMVLRSMNPQIIALDEITAQEDLRLLALSLNCGVRLLATIHGENTEELRCKPLFRNLLKMHLFEKAVVIHYEDGIRQYRIEAL